MIVNLNVECKVKLNDLGKQVWLHQFNGLPEDMKNSHPEILTALQSAINPDDTIKTTLWEIMSVFGPYLTMTSNPFSSTTIELIKNLNLGTGE